MLKQLWNKFCKIFSHYEFLVQLVFAPHFKQRHIPRYNYIKRQQQKNPRGIGKSNDPWTRLTQRIAKSFCFRPLTEVLTRVKCPTGRASFWVKFPTVRSLTRVKCPGIAPGGMGGFGIDWYITPSSNLLFLFPSPSWLVINKSSCPALILATKPIIASFLMELVALKLAD